MNKSKGKATTNNPKTKLQRSSISKTPAYLQIKEHVGGGGGFRCRTLPFVKSLSRKNALAARVLRDSYARGVAAADIGDVEDLF